MADIKNIEEIKDVRLEAIVVGKAITNIVLELERKYNVKVELVEETIIGTTLRQFKSIKCKVYL